MKQRGIVMHTMNSGSDISPIDSSHTPRGSENSSVQGTTALTSASHTQLWRNQASVDSW